jgi:hypothetical protein
MAKILDVPYLLLPPPKPTKEIYQDYLRSSDWGGKKSNKSSVYCLRLCLATPGNELEMSTKTFHTVRL